MTQAVTVYRWDDPGAPQITTPGGSANEIKAVLDAVLINGYGNKQGLGWSKVHDDINGVVYRNSIAAGGSGGMIRFWPKVANWDGTLTASGQTMLFESAADFITSSNSNKKGSFYSFRHPVSSGEKAWVIIGTNSAFYFTLGNYSADNAYPPYTINSAAKYNYSMFAGDYVSTVQDDASRFIAMAGAESGNSESRSWGNTFDYGMSTQDKVQTQNQIKIWAADNSNSHNYYAIRTMYKSGSRDTVLPQTANDLLGYGPCLLSLDAYNNVAKHLASETSPFVRGAMPGLINTIVGEGENILWPHIRQIGGVKHWLLRYAGNGRSNIWINLENWS